MRNIIDKKITEFTIKIGDFALEDQAKRRVKIEELIELIKNVELGNPIWDFSRKMWKINYTIDNFNAGIVQQLYNRVKSDYRRKYE